MMEAVWTSEMFCKFLPDFTTLQTQKSPPWKPRILLILCFKGSPPQLRYHVPLSPEGNPIRRCWQGYRKGFWVKPVSVLLCLLQIPYELLWEQTVACTVRSWRRTAWELTRPMVHVTERLLKKADSRSASVMKTSSLHDNAERRGPS